MKIAATAILLILTLVSPARPGQEITIVRGQDFPPYHYLDSHGNEKGFLIELILRAGRRLDLDIRFRQLPWSRCLHMVRDGRADAMMNLFKTEERLKFMAYTQTPIAREVNRFFTLEGSDLVFTGDFAPMRGKRIGAVRNYSYGKAFDAAAGQLTILELETEKAMLMNLITCRCDVIIGNEMVIRTLADQNGSRVIPVGPKITDDPLYIGFSLKKGHRELAQKFSQALKTVKTSPEYQTVLESYGL